MIDYKIGDCQELIKAIPDNSVDCIVTDPPYGYSFMGLDWDKALPSEEALRECCRVLKPGAFGFFMCTPRQDLLSRMIIRLEDAGFKTGFTSLYWTYASGFPKSANISKLVDKRGYENSKYSELSKELCRYLKSSRESLGLSQKDIAKHFPSKTGGLTGCVWNWENGANIPTMEQWGILKDVLKLDNEKFIELIERALLKREEAEREVIGSKEKLNAFVNGGGYKSGNGEYSKTEIDITAPATPEATALNGAYAGFSPKPATEPVIVVMKPLSEKTYVDQALKNGKGVTWLDSCRIPSGGHMIKGGGGGAGTGWGKKHEINEYRDGRFPANVLCCDDVLNDGTEHKRGCLKPDYNLGSKTVNVYGERTRQPEEVPEDSGTFSRYFDLDAWYEKKLKELPESVKKTFPYLIVPKPSKKEATLNGRIENSHPTKKPVKLMSYLITLGSREGELILDPYAGSGTTGKAARLMNRKALLFEQDGQWKNVIEEACMIKTPSLFSFS